ncbi:TPA: hypothetical protein DCG61_02795 [Patescibacteria group bacterium]|jgi:hypothetical protein|nr:hypothetical protein [Patescibacteria group bacterium]
MKKDEVENSDPKVGLVQTINSHGFLDKGDDCDRAMILQGIRERTSQRLVRRFAGKGLRRRIHTQEGQ